MSDGVKRSVRLGSMAHIDPAGRTRRADCGTDILVHPEDVERFDRLNVLAVAETPADEPVETAAEGDAGAAEEPKRRPRRRSTESED